MPARAGSRRTPVATCSCAIRTPVRRVAPGSADESISASAETMYAVVADGDLTGRRTTHAVRDQHAGRADEAGVLVAAADQADMADPDTGDPQHVATPSSSPTSVDPLTVPRPGVPVEGAQWRRTHRRVPDTMALMEWLLLAISVGLILACGVFGAAEYSFVAVDRSAVEKAASEGDRRAQGVRSALRSLSTQLSGAQIGVTLTNLVIGFLAEPAIASLLDGPLEAAGCPSERSAGCL